MKVLLADDHAIVRTGLRKILESHNTIMEVLECSDGKEAIDSIRAQKPEIAVLDISMPKLSGLEVLQKINEEKLDVKCLILSMHSEKEYAIRAIKNGAYGYLSKDSAAEELIQAIELVTKGKKYISKDLQELLLELTTNPTDKDLHEKLSEREFKVFILLAEGKSLNEIAEKLFISNKTVSTYKTRLLEKMKITSIAELTRYAINYKLIS
jgi:two-component system invasion response regulator UvrY